MNSADLVERLRDADANSQQRVLGSRIFGEAADRIEALETRLAETMEALRPFAGVSELVDLETESFSDTDTFDLMFNDFLFDRFTLAHFRTARLQEQVETLTRERDANYHMAVANGQRAKDEHYRAQAAEAERDRLRAALRETRGHFIVERHDDGRISGIGHDSQALPKIVGILDAALSEDSVKEPQP